MRLATVLLTLLAVPILNGCFGPDFPPTGADLAPEECKGESDGGGTLYTGEALREAITVDAEDPPSEAQLNAMLWAAAEKVTTFTGEPYTDASGRLSRWDPDQPDEWFLRFEGRFAGTQEDRYEFKLSTAGSAEAELRGAWREAVPESVQEELVPAVRNHSLWPEIESRTPHHVGGFWSPDWRGCIRLSFRAYEPGEPIPEPSPATEVYVVLDRAAIPPNGVLYFRHGLADAPRVLG